MAALAGLIAACLSLPAAAEDLDIVLLVDTERLHSPQAAPLRQRFLGLAPTSNAIVTQTIKPGDTLAQIVSREYGYADNEIHRAAQADIVASIKRLNGLVSDKIVAGQHLNLPEAFKRPWSKGSTSQKAQVLDLVSGVSGTKTLDSVLTVTDASAWSFQAATAAAVHPERPLSAEDAREGSIGIVRMTQSQFLQTRALLKAQKGYVAFPPIMEELTLTMNQAAAAALPTAAPSSANVSEVDKLEEELVRKAQASPGKLYLLDYFSNDARSCEHGDLVYEKAIQTLDGMGASALATRIEKVSIDFYADRQTNTEFIERWIQESFFGKIKQQYLASLALLKQRPSPARSDPKTSVAVPGLFLQAIYGTLLAGSDSLVISSSFTTDSVDSVFPRELLAGDGPTLVAAVLNVDGATLEDPIYRYQEPLRTLRSIGDETGAVIVGYKDGNGVPKGMYSATGRNVTTLDFGTVVGKHGACAGHADIGASFAAPVVSVKMLIARLLWKRHGGAEEATSARRRLLMSGRVEEGLLGKYRSAGVPSIQRLLQPPGGVILGADGKWVDARRYVGKMYFSIKSAPPINVVLGPSGISTFSALQLSGGSLFMFDGVNQAWSAYPATAIDSLCLCDGSPKQSGSLSEVMKTLSEVTLYE